MAHRYRRLNHVEALGPAAARRLGQSSVLVVGCGALGTALATLLVRAGVGEARLIDRDVVEESNLTDQCLYTERDVAECRPKAEAAAARLAAANREVHVEARVADFGPDNARDLVDGTDLIFDGSDNLPTKYLLNDVAVATGTPWVYAGCAGRIGSVLAVLPGRTHCLRCVWPTPPTPPRVDGCETMGLLPTTAFLVAALQVTEGLKVLLGQTDELVGGVLTVNVWTGQLRSLQLVPFQAHDNGCPACGQRDFPYLSSKAALRTTLMCSRKTVLVAPDEDAQVEYESVLRRLKAQLAVTVGPGYSTFEASGHRFFLYQSGRALIVGTDDPLKAHALYKRYVRP